MVFELFYVGSGQAIASFSPNELLASLLLPDFFLFVVSFCSVFVPYHALPHASHCLKRSVFQSLKHALLTRALIVLAIIDVSVE